MKKIVAATACPTGIYYFMAGVSAACITPPLVIALATTMFKKYFTQEELAAGLVNYILGCTHILRGLFLLLRRIHYGLSPY